MHSVYLAYDLFGRLSYIGCTQDVKQRLKDHTHRSDWYFEDMRVDVREYATKERALAVEKRAISLLNPYYNIRDQRPGNAYTPHVPLERRKIETVEDLALAWGELQEILTEETAEKLMAFMFPELKPTS